MIRKPLTIVILLTALNFVNYLDRYIVAAVLPRIQADFSLSNKESGFLFTIFLLGYFCTAPIFGSLGDRWSRKKLIAAGVIVWSLATITTGLSTSFAALVVSRIVCGIGEASYATLAPTIIDDIAPPDQKGKYLAIFFLATPLGSALGYVVGSQVQNVWSWRHAFYIGGGPGLVLGLVVLLIDDPPRIVKATKEKLLAVAKQLLAIPLYRRAVLGYCAHTAAIGAFSAWAPTFLVHHFDQAFTEATMKGPLAAAGTIFGAVTVVAGAIGTILGGRMSDAIARKHPVPAGASHEDASNLRAAIGQLHVCAIGVAIAVPTSAIAFFAPSKTLFYVFAGLAEVGLFMSTSPINAVMLRTAPPWLRAAAMALGIFMIHLLGDLWSPFALGAALDVLPDAVAMMMLPIAFGVATVLWWPRASGPLNSPA